jgi:hypothetical protein
VKRMAILLASGENLRALLEPYLQAGLRKGGSALNQRTACACMTSGARPLPYLNVPLPTTRLVP